MKDGLLLFLKIMALPIVAIIVVLVLIFSN